jgi:hypothetical protein
VRRAVDTERPGCGLTPAERHRLGGKEGVDGSSSSEGSATPPHVAGFAFVDALDGRRSLTTLSAHCRLDHPGSTGDVYTRVLDDRAEWPSMPPRTRPKSLVRSTTRSNVNGEQRNDVGPSLHLTVPSRTTSARATFAAVIFRRSVEVVRVASAPRRSHRPPPLDPQIAAESREDLQQSVRRLVSRLGAKSSVLDQTLNALGVA